MDKLRIIIKVTDDITPGHFVVAVIEDGGPEETRRVNFGDPTTTANHVKYLIERELQSGVALPLGRHTLQKPKRKYTRKSGALFRPTKAGRSSKIYEVLMKDRPSTSVDIHQLLPEVEVKNIAAALKSMEKRGLVRADRTRYPFEWVRK